MCGLRLGSLLVTVPNSCLSSDCIRRSDDRVLVTGASGFVGFHLVRRLLSSGATVLCLKHRSSLDRELVGAVVMDAELQDSSALRDALTGVTHVYHLAGIGSVAAAHANPDLAFRVNTLGTQSLLEAARLSGSPRVVLLSTAHVFGSPAILPIREDHLVNPKSIYAATKLASDVIAAAYTANFGLPVSILRLFNIFGPRQSAAAVIPETIRQALTGSPVKMQQLTPRRDFLYIEDAVDAITLAGNTSAAFGEELLIGSGKPTSVAEIVRRVVTLVSGIPAVEPHEPTADGDCMFGDISKAQRVLGWTPRHSLDSGLEQTILWWRQNMGMAN